MDSSRLSLKQKAGQMLMVGFPGEELDENSIRFIEENNIGFIILFSRNLKKIPSIVNLTNQIHRLAPVSPFIFSDQEGGTVVQFQEIAATAVSAMGLAATGDPVNARLAGEIIGAEMKACGIDGVLAPVLDVNRNIDNPIIGIRSFSDSADTVIQYGLEFFRGLSRAGIAACGKHYPGHGDTVRDSHAELPVCMLEGRAFEKHALAPFKILIHEGIDSILIAHILFPGLSPDIAPFSPFFINTLLRTKLNFQGLVMTDCLEMGAIKHNYSARDVVNGIMKSGVDLLVASHSRDFQQELLDAILFYVKKGKIPESRIDESVHRILEFKSRFLPPAERRTISLGNAKSILRSQIDKERRIAEQSITLLKNGKKVIPINRDADCLILEMPKIKATLPIQRAESDFMLPAIGANYFRNLTALMLTFDQEIDPDLVRQIKKYTHVIVGLYSRSPEAEDLQAMMVDRLIQIRDDLIVVSMGNPFDFRKSPRVETFIATYGFRNVQIEALFKILTGQIRPNGSLPVTIGSNYRQGYSLRG